MQRPSFRTLFVTAVLTLALASCDHYVQTSSGQDYLKSYGPAGSEPGGDGAALEGSKIDDAIVSAAAINPQLRFPARIGLARIDRGKLTPIPRLEGDRWQALADALGPDWGSFLPVSPLVAGLATAAADPQQPACHTAYDNCVAAVVNNIRLGAARQHVDAVLVYEATAWSSSESNLLAFTDLSIIGLWLAPSRSLKAGAAAQALLLDVRNGYPYGFAQVETDGDLETLSTYAGSETRATALRDRALEGAVTALVPEVEEMFHDLRLQLAVSNRQRPGVAAPLQLLESVASEGAPSPQ